MINMGLKRARYPNKDREDLISPKNSLLFTAFIGELKFFVPNFKCTRVLVHVAPNPLVENAAKHKITYQQY